MYVTLTVVGGKADRKQVRVKVPIVVGRSRESGLTIAHPMVSRRHCELFEVDGLLHVRDLGSLNGVFVQGRRVSEASLPPQCEFNVGPLTFRVDYQLTQKQPPVPKRTAAPPRVNPEQAMKPMSKPMEEGDFELAVETPAKWEEAPPDRLQSFGQPPVTLAPMATEPQVTPQSAPATLFPEELPPDLAFPGPTNWVPSAEQGVESKTPSEPDQRNSSGGQTPRQGASDADEWMKYLFLKFPPDASDPEAKDDPTA